MPYDPYDRSYQFIDEQLPVRHTTSGHRAKQPLPRRDIIGASQRQAEMRQRNLRGDTHTPPNGLPRVRNQQTRQQQGDPEEGEYNDVWPPRLPTSTRRYQTQGFSEGSTRYEFRPEVVHTNIPPRRSAQPQSDQCYTEGIPAAQTRPRIRIHWLVFAGIGAILALFAWIGAAYVNAWWTNTQNDWTYTAQFRTFSVNKAVGHNNDSAAHPSHFIVQNDNRHIIIIELPANDVSKSLIYSGPFLVGDGEERTPVTISFVENLQTGRLDMVLQVQDQTYVFTNNGTKFVPPAAGQ